MADKPEIGKFYKIIHSRKGTFYGKILDATDDGNSCDVEITSGIANAVMAYNFGYEGDIISLANNSKLTLFYECSENEARTNGNIK